MRPLRRRALAATLAMALALPVSAAPGATRQPVADVAHALDRLTFGPRPGDIEAVAKMGLARWIEIQLQPDRIPDGGLQTRLAHLQTLRLSSHDLMKGYELPREIKKKVQEAMAAAEGEADEARARVRRELRAEYRDKMEGLPRQVIEELQEAKLIRAAHSERQLEEVLVDFWMNHFNVYAQKGAVRYLVGEYEREVIRPRAFGRFEDLLKATAESPAMLFYLDNWLSSAPGVSGMEQKRQRPMGMGRGGRPGGLRRPMPPQRSIPQQAASRKRGLNENYARELMELHTVGVDGGYTQKDVTEVARCFTGWTIKGLRKQRPEFAFDLRLHDGGEKLVLGQPVKANGKGEGDEILHRLASHPNTAKFISFKLARRFVADEPPPALVERAVETFRRTDGSIREVVRTIVTSAEFLSPQYRSVKVKTPLEFAVSAVRALGATVSDGSDLARRIAGMGMPLYLQQPPTGYRDTADAWVSTSGLVARLNLALDLAGGRVSGVSFAKADPASDNESIVQVVVQRLVPAGIGESTRKTLVAEGGDDAARIAGLVLGSPEFQRR